VGELWSLLYCTQEEKEKSQKKVQVRDPRSKYPHLDIHMIEFIRKQRKAKLVVNFKTIQTEALSWMADSKFLASKDWWQRARKRMNVVSRMHTHVIQTLRKIKSRDKALSRKTNKERSTLFLSMRFYCLETVMRHLSSLIW